MKQFWIFVKKEFYHVLRDKRTLFILFGMPVVQILLFGFALTNEIKDSQILVVDHARDDASQAIITKLGASRYFKIRKEILSPTEIQDNFREGKIRATVVFPAQFNEELEHFNKAQMQVLADGSDPNTASLVTTYITSVVRDYQSDRTPLMNVPYQIVPEVRMLYNPQLLGAPNFVPGVMALVLMLVCVMMTAISIVREKEMGTMEVLLVSPFQPFLVIVSKAIPYILLSLVNLCAILLLSTFLLGLPVKGSLVLLLFESTLFIICCLSLGILISIKAKSQQVAMLISLVGMFLPTILFSGFMFPVENMPLPLQVVSNFVPSKWYYCIVKSVMIKGVGFEYIWKETLILMGITCVFLVISLKSFNVRLE